MSIQGLRGIVDELDFGLAFRRVRHDAESDFLQMPLELKIFEYLYEENIRHLKESILQDTYRVKSLRKIWVPKRDFFLRPGSIPHLEDRIVFQAIIDRIAPSLESIILPLSEEVVFSHRLNRHEHNKSMYIHPRTLWLAFPKKATEYCNTSNIQYVLVSDIASYFENIDLRHLNDTLISSGISPIYADVVRQILSVWANSRTRGIPQMIAPCSLLGNVYLNQVDKSMLLLGYKYIRYVDDIRIFVSSEVEQRKALLALTDQLRRCYLDVQASKTKFLTALKHKNDLTSLERHLIETGINIGEEATIPYLGSGDGIEPANTRQNKNEAQTTGNSEDIDDPQSDDITEEIPESKLVNFLNKLLNDPQYDDRHLRFCVNRLGKIGSPAARDIVLSKLFNMPQETATFVDYLSRLPSDAITPGTIDSILDLFETVNNIYDWQMMWLLIFLSHCKEITMGQLQRLYREKKLQDHFINRAILSYILCSRGDLVFKRMFMDRYRQEEFKEVKMAIYVVFMIWRKKNAIVFLS